MKTNLKQSLATITSTVVIENPLDKAKVLSYAIGLAVGGTLGAFPSSEVASPGVHYVETQSVLHGEAIYILNENAMFNRDQACSIARAYWRYKYNFVFNKVFNFNVDVDFFNGNSSVSMFFSPEDIAFLNQYKSQITTIANRVAFLLVD